MMTAQANVLTKRRKAAMIVHMIVAGGDSLALTSLPEKIQEDLAKEMGQVRKVDKATVAAVIEEFMSELEDVGMIAPGSPEKVLNSLGAHISPDLASKLRQELANTDGGDQWGMITALDVDKIVPIMLGQSTEIAAIALSKLSVGKAAQVLAKLPGEVARRITFAVSQTAEISPGMVRRIGSALARDHCISSNFAFEKLPSARVGAILNSSAEKVRESVLEGLGGEDAGFAEDVRKTLFVFNDIPERVLPTDIVACLRAIEPDRISVALAGALAAGGKTEETAEFILSNVSQRMAAQMRESATEMGPVKAAESEAAMNELTSGIRELADAGTIKLIIHDDEDEE